MEGRQEALLAELFVRHAEEIPEALGDVYPPERVRLEATEHLLGRSEFEVGHRRQHRSAQRIVANGPSRVGDGRGMGRGEGGSGGDKEGVGVGVEAESLAGPSGRMNSFWQSTQRTGMPDNSRGAWRSLPQWTHAIVICMVVFGWGPVLPAEG